MALATLMGVHAIRSALAMVVWNIGEERPQGALVLISAGIWLIGLLGWTAASRLSRPRTGTRAALLFAAAYAISHFIRHPVLTPAFAVAALVLWLWMLPALLGLLQRSGTLEVVVPGLLVGLAVQVALQTALHGLDMPLLRGLLPGLGAALLAVAFVAAWRTTASTAPPEPGMLFLQGWGLFALGPFLVLQLTLLANLGRMQMITGWPIDRAALLVILGLAAGLAAIPLIVVPAVRVAAALATVVLAGATTALSGPLAPAALQVTAAASLAGALAPAAVQHPRRAYLWGAIGMVLAFGLLSVFYARYEWLGLWLLIGPLVALPSLAQGSRMTPSPPSMGRAVLAVVVIGAIGLGVAHLTQRAPAPQAGAQTELRVVTYNIHMGFDARSVPDPFAQARVIDTLDADVIALQEVGRGWTVNGGVDLAAWLRWRFPQYRLVYGPMNGALWGNAILSRFPITASGSVRFPLRESRFRRGLTWVTLSTARGELLVVNTHFAHEEWAGADRLGQAGDLLAFWQARQRTVVMGDFNAPPESAPIARVRTAGLRDALAPHGLGTAPTFPSPAPSERIDYIFVSPDIQSLAGKIPRTAASDHLPVVARLRLR